jgi:hypothetical protein
MRALRILCFLALTVAAHAADDPLDRLDEMLEFSTLNNEVRARLSGLLDLEEYHFHQPAPGLIESKSGNLFNPRLTLFLDVQLGSHLYLFAQGRLDRGFDPADEGAQVRLDEYAVRFTPWDDARFNLQVGKFATVIGNWVGHHLSWENPFVTAPLPYENRTAIFDSEAARSPGQLLYWEKYGGYSSLPIIWGPDYGSGISAFGRLGKFEYAVELKNTALAAPPYAWDATAVGFDHPSVNARLGYRPNEMWNFGFSASDGVYLLPEAESSLPHGVGLSDYRERLLGQDISFAWHHWQLWAEVYEVRFDVPRVGNADTLAYYVEAKYKFLPQLFGALRWNQQFFGDINDGYGGQVPWGNDTWRIDMALGYRFTAHTQLKLQYSLQHEDIAERDHANMLAVQLTVRF